MCCRKTGGEAARKPVWRPSQFLLLGLRDHAEPLLALFSPLSAPVFASYLTGVILSCWSSKVYLSIFGTIASLSLFGKKNFIMKAIHFIKEESRESQLLMLCCEFFESIFYIELNHWGSHDLCIYHFTFFIHWCIMDIFLINTYTSVICLLLDVPSEKAMATYSSTLAWKIPWTEGPGGLQSMGSLEVGHDWVTSLSLSCIGEGNGKPLQCSCLENPRDGGAWWAAVYGVAQSRTRLKRLSSSSSRYTIIDFFLIFFYFFF